MIVITTTTENNKCWQGCGHLEPLSIVGKNVKWGFPGGAVVESLPASAGGTGSSPGLGRSHMPWSN